MYPFWISFVMDRHKPVGPEHSWETMQSQGHWWLILMIEPIPKKHGRSGGFHYKSPRNSSCMQRQTKSPPKLAIDCNTNKRPEWSTSIKIPIDVLDLSIKFMCKSSTKIRNISETWAGNFLVDFPDNKHMYLSSRVQTESTLRYPEKNCRCLRK